MNTIAREFELTTEDTEEHGGEPNQKLTAEDAERKETQRKIEHMEICEKNKLKAPQV